MTSFVNSGSAQLGCQFLLDFILIVQLLECLFSPFSSFLCTYYISYYLGLLLIISLYTSYVFSAVTSDLNLNKASVLALFPKLILKSLLLKTKAILLANSLISPSLTKKPVIHP